MLTARQLRFRFLLLLVLRWLPTGLLVPVTTLLALDRGLGVAEIGATVAVQGVVVALLELPTGGLADTLGRRPVLVLAGTTGAAALAVLAVADSVALFALAWGLQGLYRALDSGPLEAWYVDALHDLGPDPRLDRALSAGTAVAGLAIAAGALLSGLVVATVRVPGLLPTVLPVLGALALQVLALAALVLVREPPRRRGGTGRALRAVPGAVADGVRVVRASRALRALSAAALLTGAGMVAFETLLPLHLTALTGDTAATAAILGPVVAAGWLAAAAGSAVAPLLAARTGLVGAVVLVRVLQGGAIVAMGLLAGPAGTVTGLLLTQLLHGAGAPLHASVLHGAVPTGGRRAVLLSITSLLFQLGFAIGVVTLTALAAATSTGAAIVTGGVVLAAAAPLYLLTRSPPPGSPASSRPASSSTAPPAPRARRRG